MTTNITELAQSLKAAAENATPGEWCSDDQYGIAADSGLNGNYYIASCSGPEHRQNKRFIALANPANILALVEALEKAQQQNKSDFEIKARLCKESNSLHDRLRVAEKRIAELESRSVNIKFAPIQVEELGNVRDGKKHPYMFGAGYNSAVIHCESVIQQELDAKGIKWEAE
ncbi:ead/Ea22-like family protein [Klebsiella aerogenes]|uniref:ead/Ea22-like family protein n=1 Tax=Klebsiella aerogenes TaxID=548 RepID=UPI0025B5B9D1|nr:ead/Ea22-like family protein [Klebsiella aerogenes]MDN3809609.1 ead/Ea22-like family protein [Klebsiella aerogenes]